MQASMHALFPLRAERRPNVEMMHHNFLSHSLVYWHSLFPVWSDSNLAAQKHSGMGLGGDIYLHIYPFSYILGKNFRVVHRCVFKCMRIYRTFSKLAGHLAFHQPRGRVLAALQLHQRLLLSGFFLLCKSFREVVVLL